MIIITGASGFIGSEIIKTLGERRVSYKVFEGDINQRESYLKYNSLYDIVIHCAAAIPHVANDAPSDFYKVNIEGTQNILEYFKSSKIVYLSTKDVTRHHLNVYEESKKIAEKLVLNDCKNLVVRLPSIFGVGTKQKKLIPLLIKEAVEQEKCVVHNDSIREYLYVKECASLIVNNLNRNGIIEFDGVKISNMVLKEIIQGIVNKAECLKYSNVYGKLIRQLEETITGMYPREK